MNELRIGSRVRIELWDEETNEYKLWGQTGTIIEHIEDDDRTWQHKVRWDDGSITTEDGIECVTPKHYVNVYLRDRAYGGGEEGGWWYDCYAPEQEECKWFPTEAEAQACLETAQAWCDQENSERRSDISSVISEGRYEVVLEAWPAEYSPSSRPYYC